jgi:hypothetical protein
MRPQPHFPASPTSQPCRRRISSSTTAATRAPLLLQRAMVIARDVLKFDELVAPSRTILFEGQLDKLTARTLARTARRSTKAVYLFNDLLVLAEAKTTKRQQQIRVRTSLPTPLPNQGLGVTIPFLSPFLIRGHHSLLP